MTGNGTLDYSEGLADAIRRGPVSNDPLMAAVERCKGERSQALIEEEAMIFAPIEGAAQPRVLFDEILDAANAEHFEERLATIAAACGFEPGMPRSTRVVVTETILAGEFTITFTITKPES